MKKSIILLSMLAIEVFVTAGILLTENNSVYCNGWEIGYVRGYCYQDLECVKPLVPLCPLPKLNFDKYQDGINDGFVAGKKARK